MITQKDIDKVTTLCTEMMENGSEYDPDLAGAEYLDFCPEFSEVFEVICDGLKREARLCPPGTMMSVTICRDSTVSAQRLFYDIDKAEEEFRSICVSWSKHCPAKIPDSDIEEYLESGYYTHQGTTVCINEVDSPEAP